VAVRAMVCKRIMISQMRDQHGRRRHSFRQA